MGYESHITGDGITFSRPLVGAEVRALRGVFSATDWASYLLRLTISETQIETDEGILTRIECGGITPYQSGKAYGLIEDLEKVIAALPADVTASGHIERIGEEFPDAERIYAAGRTIVVHQAVVGWPAAPEGSE